MTYLDKFKNTINVIEHAGGHIGTKDGLINAELKSVDPLLTQDNFQ